MKLIHEAIVDDYHFIIGEDYLTITLKNKEMVCLNRDNAKEIITWLFGQLGPSTSVFKAQETMRKEVVNSPTIALGARSALTTDVDPLEGRKAAQTLNVGIAKTTDGRVLEPVNNPPGNPFLASTAQLRSKDEVATTVDLGKELEKHDLVTRRR